MLVRQITDDHLAQNAYLIGCQQTGEAVVIDPQRDVERYIEAAAKENLTLVAATETHVHADFVSGTRELAARLPGLRVLLSAEGGPDWQYRWPSEDRHDVTLLKPGVAVHPIIAALGPLTVDRLPLADIARHRAAASRLVDKVGFDR